MQSRNTIAVAFAAVLAVVLSGCGGGGGGSVSSPPPTPPPTSYPHGGEVSAAALAAHADNTWDGSAGPCLGCHQGEATEVHAASHYQWKGPAPYAVNGPAQQGKMAGAVNSYCINILGNWTGCGKCHPGRGAQPTGVADAAQLANVDCLMCHQKDYKRKQVAGEWVPDPAAMSVSLDQAVRTVHLPTRDNCLQCHAFAGGADAVKRGDLAQAHGATTDRVYDVHMATTGGSLACQACHTTSQHKIAGRGSDLRQTDLDVELTCWTCHPAKVQAGGHATAGVDHHVGRVACQTCHVPTYAKNAADTVATEATEVHRTWLATHATAAPYHPAATKANDLQPAYRFWNRKSEGYTLGDTAQLDPGTGKYKTSRPVGAINDPGSKLYPFKYKTAEQPMVSASQKLVALDTAVFFATADPVAATQSGLRNMGLPDTSPYTWIQTDTYQLLTHEVAPRSGALQCSACHGSTTRMDLKGSLGYGLKGPESSVCTQCHDRESNPGFTRIHEDHVADEGYDCSRCHTFSRPERGLRM